MIGRITGKIIFKQPPLLLIDVMGVGYEIEAPMSTFYRLPATGETVSLLTHLTIREDAHILFGFSTQVEKSLFRDLIKISGVGPKLALSILSGVAVDDFWAMLRAGDTARLVKIPGVGKKTAERLFIEMRDKAGASGAVLGSETSMVSSGPLQEARSALNALGYKPPEIQRLTEAVYKDGMSTEQIIQEALKRAVR